MESKTHSGAEDYDMVFEVGKEVWMRPGVRNGNDDVHIDASTMSTIVSDRKA